MFSRPFLKPRDQPQAYDCILQTDYKLFPPGKDHFISSAAYCYVFKYRAYCAVYQF